MNQDKAKETTSMYTDYLSGMTLAELGKKYGYVPETIWTRFKKQGLAMRPKGWPNRKRESVVMGGDE